MKDKKNKKRNNKNKDLIKTNIRYNSMLILIYLVGIVLIVSLFKIQILDGLDYRADSNARLTRETRVKAKRGNILDRTGKPLGTTELSYGLELYKTQVDDDKLNDMALRLTSILESNKEKYEKGLIISVNPFKFINIDLEKLEEWKESRGIPSEASAKESFYLLRDKYNIKTENVEDIAKILNIRELIEEKGYGQVSGLEIAETISRKSALEITAESNKLSGVNVTNKPNRKYNVKTLAAHIIGYIGRIDENEYEENIEQDYQMNDVIGKTGIERTFEEFLKGEDGLNQIDMTLEGNVIGEYTIKEAIGGSDVILTIDSSLQSITEKSLESRITALRRQNLIINGGSAVVMNIHSGEILAMASYPTFSPSAFLGGISAEDWKKYNVSTNPLMNRAIQGTYEPGSAFKMVPALAALNEKKISTADTVYCTGIYNRAHNPKCWTYRYSGGGHGAMDTQDALKNSCNVYFYEMGYRLGIDLLEKYTRYFGLGEKTGIELKGEVAGFAAGKETAKLKGETWTEGGTLSAAIGQSYNSFSPLQLAKYVSMIANDGKMVKPTIVKSVINSIGTAVSKEEINRVVNKELDYEYVEPEEIKFKQSDIDAIHRGMRDVTSGGGTASWLFTNLPITIAGKTGTAEAGDYVNGTFVCFAPYDTPEIAIAVVIENGQSGGEAAIVAREILKEYTGMNAVHIKEKMTVQKEGSYII